MQSMAVLASQHSLVQVNASVVVPDKEHVLVAMALQVQVQVQVVVVE